jgi:serine O-acetyltransferase
MLSSVIAAACRLSPAFPLIRADADAWALSARWPERKALRVMCSRRECRPVIYARLRAGGGIGRYLAALLRRVAPGEATLQINTADIGPGTRFVHGFATIALAQSIGAGCLIFHCVTIGDSPPRWGLPTIGNRVLIFPGAVVAGPITVGDGAVIGANSVVTRDVPAGEVWAGNPARRIGDTATLVPALLR